MKFLTYFEDRSDLERHERLFREKGIPIHVESTRGLAYFNKWAIHVWIDSQFMDAQRLLEDPKHIPESPVDVNEFFDASRSVEVDLSQFFSPGFLTAIGAVVLFAIIIVFRAGSG